MFLKEVFLGGMEEASWLVLNQKFSYTRICWSQSIRGYVHENPQGKPVETDEKRCHMFTLSCPCDEMGGMVACGPSEVVKGVKGVHLGHRPEDDNYSSEAARLRVTGLRSLWLPLSIFF